MVSGSVPGASISSVYDEYCGTRLQRGRPYVPSPSVPLVATLSTLRSAGGGRSFGLRRRVPPYEEVIFLRKQLREVVARHALTVQRIREQVRQETMMEWIGRGVSHWGPVGGPNRGSAIGGGGFGVFPSVSSRPEPKP